MSLKQIYTRLFLDFPYSYLTYAMLAFGAVQGLPFFIGQLVVVTILVPIFIYSLTNI